MTPRPNEYLSDTKRPILREDKKPVLRPAPYPLPTSPRVVELELLYMGGTSHGLSPEDVSDRGRGYRKPHMEEGGRNPSF